MPMTRPVSLQEAIQIAKRAAADRGHPWIEPTIAFEREGAFHVSSNAESLGGNIVVVIDTSNGAVRSINVYAR